MSTLAGATMLPSEPPTDCAAAISTVLTPRPRAVSACRAPNITFEVVLLPVMKQPSTPMKGDSSGKSGPVARAMPCASVAVMPASFITRAIITVVAIPTLVGTHCFTVRRSACRPMPLRQRPDGAVVGEGNERGANDHRRGMEEQTDLGVHGLGQHRVAARGLVGGIIQAPGHIGKPGFVIGSSIGDGP